MQDKEEHQGSKEGSPLDAKAARTPSSPANVFGSPLPWHGRSASPAFVSAPNWEEAYQEKKEGRFDAQRPHAGARKWTISPLNHDFSSMSLDASARSLGNAFENSAMAFTCSSSSQNLLSSANSTPSSSSIGFSEASDTDMRNPTNVLGALFSIDRLWEQAIAAQNIQNVQQLLKCGFDASGEGAQMNKPPLILAVLTGNGALVKLLLTAGADINCGDSESMTPLHYAAAAGDRNIVKLLLVAGADLYARTKQGLFPMHLATDGPTYQILSQRLRSDMDKPFTPSWIGLPQQSSSGNMEALTRSSFPSQNDFQGQETASFAINDNQSKSGTPVEGPQKGLFFCRHGSFGQSDLEVGLASDLLEGKMSFPSSSNAAAFSNQDVSGSISVKDAERKDFNFNEDWISSFYNRDAFDKGKQPIESHNVWLQNIFQDKAKSQEATRETMIRNQELNYSGGEGHIDKKDTSGKRLVEPEETIGGLFKNSTSASSRGELENQEAVWQSGSILPSEYVQDKKMDFGSLMDQIFEDQEKSLITSRDSQLKLDQKGLNNPAGNVFRRNEEVQGVKPVRSDSELSWRALSLLDPISNDTKNQGVKPARSDSEVSWHALSLLDPISGPMNDTKNQGTSSTPSETFCSSNSGQSNKQKAQTIKQGFAFTEMKEALKDCGTCAHNTSQSNVLSEDGVRKTDVNKLEEEDTKLEDTSKVLPAHDHDSYMQGKERKQVKFVPPLEADLALVRKDWHNAARAGCVGCGAEGCGGECLPKNAYGKMNQEKPSNESSSSRSKKNFKKAQMKKTKNFEWKRGELIGEGAYGKVFCGLNQSTGELMAVKQLKFHNLNDDEEKGFYLTCLEREISLYKEMRHKHIVGYIDMDKDEKSGYLYIFLEYVSGGSIQSMLERFGPFSEPLVRVYTRQLLLGLEYLHKNRIVHRDIKGGNVLVDSDGVVKLADFGASKAFHEATITDACKSIRGSVFWMAPEVIKGDNYGRHADMWSVGCTVIEMLTAMHPWPGIDNTWAAIFQIAKASSGPPVPETVSDCAKDFLAKCFHLDPKRRARASQLLEHPFVAKAPELEQGGVKENV